MSIADDIGYLDASLRAQGSIKEHKFWVQSIDDGVGRRIALRQFMGRDEPGTADLGRVAREHRLEVFLAMDVSTTEVPGVTVTSVATDVLERKQNLIDELETAGVKILTHPTWGELPVRVSGAQRISEQMSTLGRVSVSFTFIEAGDPIPYIFFTEQIDNYVADARLAIDADADRMSLLDQIQEFIEAGIAKIEAANSALRQARGRVAARMAVVDNLASAINDLDDNLAALAATPGQIANQFRNLVEQIMQLISNNIPTERGKPRPTQVAVDTCRDLVAFGEDDPTEPVPEDHEQTPQRAAHIETKALINNMVRSSAIVETSLVLTQLDFESADEAASIRDTMTELGDTVSESETIGRDLFVALEDVRATLSAHLTATAQNLPKVTTYTPPETMPALVIAWELYGDITRADEIIDRNNVQRPNFVPGGVPLEVLSD